MYGKKNDLVEKLLADKEFCLAPEDVQTVFDPKKFVGLAEQQTSRFVKNIVEPILEKYKDFSEEKGELNV